MPMFPRFVALVALVSVLVMPAQALTTSVWAQAVYGGGVSWFSGNWGSVSAAYGAPFVYAPVVARYEAPGAPEVPVAKYVAPSAASSAIGVRYTTPATVTSAPTVTYTAPSSVSSQIKAVYTAPTGAGVTPVAKYTAPTAPAPLTANYEAPVTYAPLTVTYTAPSTTVKPTATYTNPSAPEAIRVTYQAPAASAGRIIANYSGGTGSASRGIVANYSAPVSREGAAFGSLFGDGAGGTYGESAGESFLGRIRSQSSPDYTYRARTLDTGLGSYGSGSGTGGAYATDYDRSFEGSTYGNLNAVPVRTVTAPQAVAATGRSLAQEVPVTSGNTSYTTDLQALRSRGILPASWSRRVASTPLTRADIAELTSRLRAWRDTGTMVAEDWRPAAGVYLPILTDLANDAPSYRFFLDVTNKRILYMPDLRLSSVGRAMSARAEATAPATRGQSLQAIMTALYLRPVHTFSNTGTDLPLDAWYTAWALTAKSYGLDFGTRFRAQETITQESAVHMVAVLLGQMR